MMVRKTLSSVVIVGAVALTGCSGGSSDNGPGYGTVSLAVSDAPIQDARQLCLEFTEAEFKKAGSGSEVVVFDPPAKVDLLAYQGMNLAPLFTEELMEAGEYQWVRLAVNADRGANGGAGAGSMDTECLGSGSYIVTEDGAVHGLYIPSGATSGLKLNRGFTLPVGGEANFVAEFDLMKSVHDPEGLDPDYIMRPTIQLLDLAEVGSIAGEVAMDLATAEGCTPTVHVFLDGEVPDDNEDDGVDDSVDPVASVDVVMQNDGRFLYEVGPILTGSYLVTFTCQADEPLVDEDIEYLESADNPVEVLEGVQSEANF
jgi:hypothetical protein